jgi:microcystin degradation protein MlrC
VLKHLVKAKLTEPAAIFLVDPEATVQLSAAGVGATFTLPIGAKFDRRNSKPVRASPDTTAFGSRAPLAII